MHDECTAPEEWRAVVGFEGLYSVSSTGRVRSDRRAKGSYPGRILKPATDTSGRLYLNLSRYGTQRVRPVHRIVADAFLGPLPPSYQTNHRDGDHLHNCASNLEYLTDTEHKAHSVRLGLVARGERRPETDLTEADILAIRESAEPPAVLAARYGNHVMTIYKIRRGYRWKHVGGPLTPNLGKGKYPRHRRPTPS